MKDPIQKAFTLIELLMVIALLGILASMVGPGFFEYLTRENLIGSQKTMAKELEKAYTTARTKPLTVTATGLKGQDHISLMTCSAPDTCTTKILELEGATLLEGDDFSITFAPPFGDITNLSEPLLIGLNVQNQPSFGIKKIKVWEKSGLIELIDSK